MPHIAYMATAGGGGGGVLTIFDTKNQSVGTVPPSPLPDPPKASRTSLLALLSVSGEEDFESRTINHLMGVDVTTLTSNGITATVAADPTPSGDGLIGSIQIDTSFGRYSTTPEGSGSKYWEFDAFYSDFDDTFVSAKLTFSTPIAAFWFYATDAGDFAATLKITMHKTGGGTDLYTPDMPSGASNGALNFWGLVDDRGTTTYDAVSIRRTNESDVIGLDGIGFATAAQIL